ncbi:MAG: hypothetical protein Q4D23_10365, partial [Bacteroidales bacterium]|nr:hypothetical protein [Bacteroidales bacterium]
MRLSKVTKEFNVSLQRVIDVLSANGINLEDPTLNSKVDDSCHDLFVAAFGADKAMKDEADNLFKDRREEKQAVLDQARAEREAEKAAAEEAAAKAAEAAAAAKAAEEA